MTLNEKLKARRLALGLTLEDVGNYVGVGKSTVRKWETGAIKDMKRSQIAKYAEILRIFGATKKKNRTIMRFFRLWSR